MRTRKLALSGLVLLGMTAVLVGKPGDTPNSATGDEMRLAEMTPAQNGTDRSDQS